jgi:hypothetical protein
MRSVEESSFSTSRKITSFSPRRTIPLRYSAASPRKRFGGGATAAGSNGVTAVTESTTAPIHSPPPWRMRMRVSLRTSTSGISNRRRRLTIGTTRP